MGITLARRGEQGQASMDSIEKIRPFPQDPDQEQLPRRHLERSRTPTVIIVAAAPSLPPLIHTPLVQYAH